MNSTIKLLLIVREPATRVVSDYAQIMETKLRKGKQVAPFHKRILTADGEINDGWVWFAWGVSTASEEERERQRCDEYSSVLSLVYYYYHTYIIWIKIIIIIISNSIILLTQLPWWSGLLPFPLFKIISQNYSLQNLSAGILLQAGACTSHSADNWSTRECDRKKQTNKQMNREQTDWWTDRKANFIQ